MTTSYDIEGCDVCGEAGGSATASRTDDAVFLHTGYDPRHISNDAPTMNGRVRWVVAALTPVFASAT